MVKKVAGPVPIPLSPAVIAFGLSGIGHGLGEVGGLNLGQRRATFNRLIYIDEKLANDSSKRGEDSDSGIFVPGQAPGQGHSQSPHGFDRLDREGRQLRGVGGDSHGLGGSFGTGFLERLWLRLAARVENQN